MKLSCFETSCGVGRRRFTLFVFTIFIALDYATQAELSVRWD